MNSTYNRRGKVDPKASEAVPQPQSAQTQEQPQQAGMRVDGFQQVLEMLRAADPAFRKSLLLRIASKDPVLGARLTQRLASNT